MRRILTLVAAFGLLSTFTPAWAAVTANSVVTAQTPNNGKQNFVQGTDSAGTYKTLYTAGANGSKCNSVVAATNDGTAQHVLTFEIVNGGTSYPLSSFTSTLAPTNNTTYATMNVISSTNFPGLSVDSDGNPYILLVSGDTLKATFATALTSSDQIEMYAACADF